MHGSTDCLDSDVFSSKWPLILYEVIYWLCVIVIPGLVA